MADTVALLRSMADQNQSRGNDTIATVQRITADLVAEPCGHLDVLPLPEETERLLARDEIIEDLRAELAELRRCAEQAIREYDALGPDGPAMPGIDKWLRAALTAALAEPLEETREA